MMAALTLEPLEREVARVVAAAVEAARAAPPDGEVMGDSNSRDLAQEAGLAVREGGARSSGAPGAGGGLRMCTQAAVAVTVAIVAMVVAAVMPSW